MELNALKEWAIELSLLIISVGHSDAEVRSFEGHRRGQKPMGKDGDIIGSPRSTALNGITSNYLKCVLSLQDMHRTPIFINVIFLLFAEFLSDRSSIFLIILIGSMNTKFMSFFDFFSSADSNQTIKHRDFSALRLAHVRRSSSMTSLISTCLRSSSVVAGGLMYSAKHGNPSMVVWFHVSARICPAFRKFNFSRSMLTVTPESFRWGPKWSWGRIKPARSWDKGAMRRSTILYADWPGLDRDRSDHGEWGEELTREWERRKHRDCIFWTFWCWQRVSWGIWDFHRVLHRL